MDTLIADAVASENALIAKEKELSIAQDEVKKWVERCDQLASLIEQFYENQSGDTLCFEIIAQLSRRMADNPQPPQELLAGTRAHMQMEGHTPRKVELLILKSIYNYYSVFEEGVICEILSIDNVPNEHLHYTTPWTQSGSDVYRERDFIWVPLTKIHLNNSS